MARTLTIGQVAKSTGVPAKTIRYYEGIGVLPNAARTSSGYRQYDETAVERLCFVSRARSLGLPLQRLRMLTTALDGGPRATLRPRLFALVREQLSTVHHQIAQLELLRQQLERVSHRMGRSGRRRRDGVCHCLDADDTTHRQQRRLSRRS